MIRKTTLIIGGIGFICLLSSLTVWGQSPENVAAPTPEKIFNIKPAQPDVEVDTPGTPEEIEKCKVIPSNNNEIITVRDANDRLLRRLYSQDRRSVNQFSFFKNGIEVFRQFNESKGKPNEFRWLNNAGSRWGVDLDGDSVIDRWKMISPEEVASEVVLALAQGDVKRFQRLAPSSEELATLGLTSELESRVKAKLEQMQTGFADIAKKIGLSRDAKGVQLSAGKPGIVMLDSSGNRPVELLAYENAIALVRDGEEPKQIILGTLVKMGDNNWRLIGVPEMDDTKSQQIVYNFTFFPPKEMAELIGADGERGNETAPTEEMAEFFKVMQAKQQALQSAPIEQRPGLHEEILHLTLQVATSAVDPENRDMWIRQAVDDVRGAVQMDEYPDGPKKLDVLFNNVKKLDTPETAAYVRFWQIMSEYYAQLIKGEDSIRLHADWSDKLTKFIEEYEKTESAGEGMMKLAEYNEMIALSKEPQNVQMQEAQKWYNHVAKDFSEKAVGKKAEGAIRRINSVGEVVPFSGKTFSGQPIQVGQFKGAYVILYFWDSWSDTELKNLKVLAERLGKDAMIIGVNLNRNREEAEQYLAQNPVPFPQIYEQGALESPPALYWGVQTVPMFVLYDKDGKVLKQNLSSSADLVKVLNELRK